LNGKEGEVCEGTKREIRRGAAAHKKRKKKRKRQGSIKVSTARGGGVSKIGGVSLIAEQGKKAAPC